MAENENEMDGGSLRKELEKALAKNKELADQVNSFAAKERVRSVESFLSEKGLNPKLARFVPADASSPEQLESWVKENSDLFAATPAASSNQDGSGEPSVPASTQEVFSSIQKVSEMGTAQPVDLAALKAQIESAKDPKDLKALLGSYRMV